MTAAERQGLVARAFVNIADSLVDDFDLLDLTIQLAEDCARLLDIAAVGLLLADAGGTLRLLAATSERARHLEVFQLQQDQGPCVDCYHSGHPVSVADLGAAAARWPLFTAAALREGFRSVHAIPMRLRGDRLGALGLFGTTEGALDPDDLELAQAFAHVASIAIVQQHNRPTRSGLLPDVHAAVASRGALEMAKGIVAASHDVDMQQAFERLRRHARRSGQPLSVLARDLVEVDAGQRKVLLSAIERSARADASEQSR